MNTKKDRVMRLSDDIKKSNRHIEDLKKFVLLAENANELNLIEIIVQVNDFYFINTILII